MKGLYRVLDSHLVLGKSQTLLVDYSMVQKPEEQDNDYGYLQDLEYLAKNQKYERLQKETENLIRKWGREERPQIWMESRLRQICYLLQRYGAGNEDYRECEFLLDEAFANAEDIEQLSASMADILFKDKKEDSAAMQRVSTEEYFHRIKEYIQTHMAQPLTLQVVSKEMGVSQTYLSRLFRKFENEMCIRDRHSLGLKEQLRGCAHRLPPERRAPWLDRRRADFLPHRMFPYEYLFLL